MYPMLLLALITLAGVNACRWMHRSTQQQMIEQST